MLLDSESNRRFKPPIAHSEARQRTGVVAWVSRQQPAPNGDRWPTWLRAFSNFRWNQNSHSESQAPRSCIHVYKDSEPYILNKTRHTLIAIRIVPPRRHPICQRRGAPLGPF